MASDTSKILLQSAQSEYTWSNTGKFQKTSSRSLVHGAEFYRLSYNTSDETAASRYRLPLLLLSELERLQRHGSTAITSMQHNLKGGASLTSCIVHSIYDVLAVAYMPPTEHHM